MKKSRKLMLRILPIFFILAIICMSSANIFAVSIVVPSTGTAITKITKVAENIWGTIAKIVQILAIAAIILAGIRYMFASADAKADIKTQTVVLVVGAILVFAAVPIAQWIANTASDIFSPSPAPVYNAPIGPTLPHG